MSAFDHQAPVQREKKTEAAPTDALNGPAVQLKSLGGYDAQRAAVSPGMVQMRGGREDASQVHEVADKGLGGGGAMPHADAIQQSFGGHDVSGISASVGGAAAEANKQLGSEAYAKGDQVAFKDAPSLHTAAHEAAHSVVQRSGQGPSSGVGQAGDAFENHADAVADKVVAGESAEGLLSGMAGGPAGGSSVQKKADSSVQMTGVGLDEDLPEGVTPDHGERTSGGKVKQRRWGIEQYVEQWEKEKGRPMTAKERATLERGCIGIVVLNLYGQGNPPLNDAYNTFDQAEARQKEVAEMIKEHPNMPASQLGPYSGKAGDYKAVLFGKLFWSNQKPKPDRFHFNYLKRHDEIGWVYDDSKTQDENVKAYIAAFRLASKDKDPDAFPVDPETGKVNMDGYKYIGRPKFETGANGEDVDTGENYVNFDYAFWDSENGCFWHANHMQYKDPEKQKTDPMIVLQSTKEKFTAGYMDFDRVLFGVGLQKGYDPESHSWNHAG